MGARRPPGVGGTVPGANGGRVSGYLLDTTALIDFSKGRAPTDSRILARIEAGDELGVCAINIAEFYAGLSATDRQTWDEFIDALQFWDVSREAAKRAGAWRYDFARKGIQLTTTDTLV